MGIVSDHTIQAQIESILGAALRQPPRRTFRLAVAAGTLIFALAGAASILGWVQQRQPISPSQLRVLQGYVCLISTAGDASSDRVWLNLRLMFDLASVHTLRRGDFDRAVDWLDRRAQRALVQRGPARSGQSFCGDPIG